jgi:hypothetical protein
MKFPHTLQILRPSGTDSYGNLAAGFTTPITSSTVAFVVQRSSTSGDAQTRINLALLPPATDIRASDRVVFKGATYDVVGDVITASSPSKDVIKTATLRAVRGG